MLGIKKDKIQIRLGKKVHDVFDKRNTKHSIFDNALTIHGYSIGNKKNIKDMLSLLRNKQLKYNKSNKEVRYDDR